MALDPRLSVALSTDSTAAVGCWYAECSGDAVASGERQRVHERSERFRRLAADWRRERLGVRTVVVTLRDAVRTTRQDTRSSPEDRGERLRRMTAWALASLQAHATSARVLAKLTDAARASGAVSVAEATLLAKLADESARGLTDADRELAAIPEDSADARTAVSAATDAPRSDEAFRG